MSLILGNTIEIPFIYCKDNIIHKVNEGFIDLTGYSYEEIVGQSLKDLISLLEIDSQNSVENNEYKDDLSIYTKEKIRKDITISWENLTNENEKIYFIKENVQKKSKSFLENISDEITYFDHKGEYIYTNKSAKDTISTMLDNLEFQNSKTIYDKVDFINMDGTFNSFEDIPSQRILRGESIYNHIYFLVSNVHTAYYEVSGNPIYDNSGILIGGVTIFRDITNRFETEEYAMLKKNEKNILLSYASLSYPDLKITYINNKAYNIAKIYNPHINSPSSMVGNSLLGYYNIDKNTEEEMISTILGSIEKEPHLYIENYKFVENGEEKYIKIIFQPIFGLEKQIKKIIAIGVDITEEEIAKKEMTRALQTQEEIFINASHELKTPVNLIFSAAQLCELYLKRDPFSDSKDDIAHSTNIIMQNCYRLTKIINNILDVSKIESGFYDLNLSNENIVQVVEDIVEAVSDYIEKDNIKIIFDTDIEENIIACDLDKVQRIILSLISNAIKFSSPDGIIFVNLISKDDFIEISVEDTGIGIHENDFKLIFDKFLQVDKSLNRRSEGTGFGLSLVKSFVELHGGTIYVESNLGKGSIFKIKFPTVTVDQLNIPLGTNSGNILEKIKLEFSDIYSL